MKTNPAPDDPVTIALDGTTNNEHSVLVLKEIDGSETLFKMPVEADGLFTDPPEIALSDDSAKRLVFSLTGATLPDVPANEDKSHISFGILPIKPDPTSAHYCCYLVNSDLLYPQNVWTRGPWNGPSGGGDELPKLETPVLLATERGTCVLVDRNGNGARYDLSDDAEAWRLLRNGCVVGMVRLKGQEKLVPLINLAAFTSSHDALIEPKIELEGTWDFKWPAGAVIRVRIDPPNLSGDSAVGWVEGKRPHPTPAEAAAAVSKVFELGNLWLKSAGIPAEALSLELVPPGGEVYDVFINLDPLSAVGAIKAPQSDLGTYAQRRTFGEPTSYCGHPEGLKANATDLVEDYYTSAAFTHIVLHEFGHIFGLPHLHQHPANRNGIIKPELDSQLRALIKNVVGLDVDEKTLTSDMRVPWPGNAYVYSDWPKIAPELLIGTLAGDSVMMGHPIRGVLVGDDVEPRLQYMSAPGSKDSEWLRLLYAPAPPAA